MVGKKKILYVIRPVEGGMKEHLLTLVRYLMTTKEFQPAVACPPASPLYRQLTEEGGEVYPLPLAGELSPAKDAVAALSLRRLIARLRPHILHCHGSKAGLVGRLAILPMFARPPVIVTVHNSVFYPHWSERKKKVIAGVEKLLAPLAERMVTVSQALREELLARTGINPAQVEVIYNGLDFALLERKLQPREEARHLLGVPKEAKVIGTVARFAPQKGLSLLIQAFAGLCRKLPEKNLWLVLVGDGPLRGELEKRAAASGVGERIVFAGYRPEAAGLLSAFDLFVLPSLSEGLGIALIEAQACGLPVVATRCGGIPEVVEDGVTGLLVNPGSEGALQEAMLKLLLDEEGARKMGQRGRQQVRTRFSLAGMLEAHSKLYREIIKTQERQG